MAIHFTTSDPQGLLKEFDKRIAQSEPKGKITTWERNTDGFYTHKADNWTKKAWFLPKIEKNLLTFHIIKPKSTAIQNLTYAYYHGHLSETFLNHFDTLFADVTASALPKPGDKVS